MKKTLLITALLSTFCVNCLALDIEGIWTPSNLDANWYISIHEKDEGVVIIWLGAEWKWRVMTGVFEGDSKSAVFSTVLAGEEESTHRVELLDTDALRVTQLSCNPMPWGKCAFFDGNILTFKKIFQ